MFSLRSVFYDYKGRRLEDFQQNDSPIIDGIFVEELDIQTSGLTAIIGKSGSGKTTLLSILAGFLQPTNPNSNSRLHFDGSPIPKQGHKPGDVAFVFQSPMLLGAGNIALNMLQGRVASKRSANLESDELLQMRRYLIDLGILNNDHQIFQKRSRDLSGGERQRVAVLRALFTNPKAILCDEPTSSLDEYNANKVLNSLKCWAKTQERPVLWVTHNLEQAAAYADHFVFVADGRIHPVSDEVHHNLTQGNPTERLAKLRACVSHIYNKEQQTTENSQHIIGNPPNPLRVPSSRYASWIAQALSTDTTNGGLVTIDLQANREGYLWPLSQTKLIQRFDPLFNSMRGFFGMFWRRWVSYTGYGLALILLVLIAQIFAAEFGGNLAQTVAKERLQHPAVARIVFDHFVFGQNNEAVKTPDLYPGDAMTNLSNDLREQIKLDYPLANTSNVAVFGRRVIDGGGFMFQSGLPKCQTNLFAPQNDTIALSRHDPILTQVELHEDLALLPEMEAFEPPAPSTIDGALLPRVLFDAALLERLIAHCEFDATQPIPALWAAGQAGVAEMIPVEIVGGISKFPPLYPLTPEVLVFEADYQFAASYFEEATPGPFRVVSAYFPIEGFDAAATVIRDKGYRLRDDSEAAVKTLVLINNLAQELPPWVVALNLLGCALVVVLIVDSLLTMNKRVLALFVAHGFGWRDTVLVLAGYILPALIVASLGLVAVVLLVLWPFLSTVWVQLPENAMHLRNRALMETLAWLLLGAIILIAVVVTAWWFRTRARLKFFLQE